MTIFAETRVNLVAACLAIVVSAGCAGPGDQDFPIPLVLTDDQGSVLEDAYLRTPLAAADRRYAAIEGEHLKGMVEEIAAISLTSRD